MSLLPENLIDNEIENFSSFSEKLTCGKSKNSRSRGILTNIINTIFHTTNVHSPEKLGSYNDGDFQHISSGVKKKRINSTNIEILKNLPQSTHCSYSNSGYTSKVNSPISYCESAKQATGLEVASTGESSLATVIALQARGEHEQAIRELLSISKIDNYIAVDRILSDLLSDWMETAMGNWGALRTTCGDTWMQKEILEAKTFLSLVNNWINQKLNHSYNLLAGISHQRNAEKTLVKLLDKCDAIASFYKSGFASF